MKLIPTFCNGNFHGFETMKEINRLRNEANRLAMCKQKTENADHMIYGYYSLDTEGNITQARLYSGIAKTDQEFEQISIIPNSHIYAIHNHR